MSSIGTDHTEIATALKEWEGGFATLWSYSVSHQLLDIRFTSPERDGNLHLLCGDCERIALPARWRHTGLIINREAGVTIEDEANRVHIDCGSLRIRRNVDPVY